MAEEYYKPTTTVEWGSDSSATQFHHWKREVERIMEGPYTTKAAGVKLNHVYIWGGSQAEQLVEAWKSEDPTSNKVDTYEQLLTCLEKCLTHHTQFREAREDFYSAKQKPGENATTYHSRLIHLHKLGDFPDETNFLIVDKIIHGCTNPECKRKLLLKNKNAKVKDVIDVVRQYESIDVSMKRFSHIQDATIQDATVKAAYSQDPTRRSQQRGSKQKTSKSRPPVGKEARSKPDKYNKSGKSCKYCGGDSHNRDTCPARDQRCLFCNKRGHYSKVCRLMKCASEMCQSMSLEDQEPEGSINKIFEESYLSDSSHDEFDYDDY